MRRITILMAISFVACGPAGSSIAPGPELPARVQATSTGVDVQLDVDERLVGDVVSMTVDDAWSGVVGVYGELGFPIAVADPGGRVIATESFRAPREILDRRLSAYMDCGHSLTGARVDLWRVSARLMTEIEATDDGASVRSRFTGSARPRDGSSTSPVPCSSSGELEREIIRRVREGGGGV